jgi:hypothetical protein
MSQVETPNLQQLHGNSPACDANTGEYCHLLQPIELVSSAKSVFNGACRR